MCLSKKKGMGEDHEKLGILCGKTIASDAPFDGGGQHGHFFSDEGISGGSSAG